MEEGPYSEGKYSVEDNGALYIEASPKDSDPAYVGRMAYMDGSVYNGDFKDKIPHGYGIKFWENGVRY